MASRKALLIPAAMAVVVVGALLPATTSAANYVVADDAGWDTGVDYKDWASGKTFYVGDNIEFVYPKGSHNVVVVDGASYDACAVSSKAPTFTSGNDNVVLFGPARYFFVCGFEGHCDAGMKLVVDVL